MRQLSGEDLSSSTQTVDTPTPSNVARLRSIAAADGRPLGTATHIERRLPLSPSPAAAAARPARIDHPYWSRTNARPRYHVRQRLQSRRLAQFCIQASRIHARPSTGTASESTWSRVGAFSICRRTFCDPGKIHTQDRRGAGAEITTLLHDTSSTARVRAARAWFPESPQETCALARAALNNTSSRSRCGPARADARDGVRPCSALGDPG